MMFTDMHPGSRISVVNRFRGGKRKAGESSLRVSMTRPLGTWQLRRRLLSGGSQQSVGSGVEEEHTRPELSA